MELELRINGVVESLDVAVNETVLSMLRREGYYSVKQGCETGECGACTVLVDGVPRPSCVMLAGQAGGCTLTTVEGLETAHKLHPLQDAFVEVGAVQCGFCIPGMLLSASALLQQNSHPTESEVREALSGNLCRCTGYVKPVQAVLRAAAIMRGEKVEPVAYSTVSEAPAQNLSLAAEKLQSMATEGAGGVTTKIPVITANAATLKGTRLDTSLEVVGKPVANIDAIKLVTGKPVFAADISRRGMLYARILTSPHAHAKIRNINVAEAKALPGVLAVLTYKDIPRVPYSGVERSLAHEGPHDQYVLDNILRYVGDRVAVIAAETPEIAEQALNLILVDYDVLPVIVDPRQALDPGAPCLHPEPESYGIFDAAHNVAARSLSTLGDVEQGFATAEMVVEGEYVVPAMQQTPLENHTVVTYFDDDEYLVVQTSSEAPHHVRRTLAGILNLPSHRIRVIKPSIGGGFGVKQEIVLEDICALLTLATHRPVMLALSRTEEFTSSRVRQQHVIRMKTGVMRDGTIVANQMVLLASTGAYGTHPLITAGNAPSESLSLYPCPNTRYVAEVLYTNQPPSGALRDYGAPHEFFALECHMDEIAKRLKIDALELRRKNWLKAGDSYPWLKILNKGKEVAPIIESCGLPECLRVVEEKLNWHVKHGRVGNGRFRRGVGLALSLYGNPGANTGISGAMIKLNEDGSFDVFASANDSTGDAKTLLAQIVAEVLGVSVADIVLRSYTDALPSQIGESASSSLYLSGGAVKRAAEQVRRQVLAVGGRMLSALPESLKINKAVISAPNGQSVTVAQVAQHCLYVENRHIMTTASWKQSQMPVTFAAQGVEVEVDTENGSLRVISVITAVDAGHAINPMIAEGQIQGSVAQGLGVGMCEELIYDQKGTLLTTNLSDYRLYSAQDMPELQAYLVETNDSSGPFGAKEIAEIPLCGVAPALANALTDALGIRVRQLPLTPERILRAIHAQAQTQVAAR